MIWWTPRPPCDFYWERRKSSSFCFIVDLSHSRGLHRISSILDEAHSQRINESVRLCSCMKNLLPSWIESIWGLFTPLFQIEIQTWLDGAEAVLYHEQKKCSRFLAWKEGPHHCGPDCSSSVVTLCIFVSNMIRASSRSGAKWTRSTGAHTPISGPNFWLCVPLRPTVQEALVDLVRNGCGRRWQCRS